MKLESAYAVGMPTYTGSGKLVDCIGPDTLRIVDHDDGTEIVKSIKAHLNALNGNNEEDLNDDGLADNAAPVEVALGRVILK